MAMSHEHGVLRLRGTFLDIGPDKSRLVRRNSFSTIEDSILPDDSSWIEAFIDRSNTLSSQQVEAERTQTCARKRASTYNTNGYDAPLTALDLGHFGEDRVCNSSRVAEINKLEGEKNVHHAGIMCHAPMTADSHTVAQNIESPVTTFVGADSSLSRETTAAAEATTLMISYIPVCMKMEEFGDLIHSYGIANSYDLLYIPISAKCQGKPSGIKNLGYAFVNFRKPEGAEAFAENFKGFRFPRRQARKHCTARPAHCQGFEENMQMYNSGKAPGWLGIVGEDGVMKCVST
jgi:hypothetical protein